MANTWWIGAVFLASTWVGGCSAARAEPTPVTAPRPLDASERIVAEMVIGAVPFSEIGNTAAVDVLTRDTILGGTRLAAPVPQGLQLDNADLSRRINEELGQQLGGWFAQDLTQSITLYDSLVSAEERERYRAGGATMQWDQTQTAFYSMGFDASPWRVQAVGEPGVFHAVSLVRDLDDASAMQADGTPAVHPFGAVEDLLAQAAPTVVHRQLRDQTADHAPNIYDTYLTDGGLTIKAGVRTRVEEDGSLPTSGPTYFYAIRINLDLRNQ